MNERIESIRQELRRGVLVLAVLSVLDEEHYGYSLRQLLKEQGLDIEEGTLYPLIRRLEGYGLLSSRWSAGDGRKRRYYRLSDEGKEVRAVLLQDWEQLQTTMNRVQKGQQDSEEGDR